MAGENGVMKSWRFSKKGRVGKGGKSGNGNGKVDYWIKEMKLGYLIEEE